MPKERLTNARVRDLPVRDVTVVYWDHDVSGFGCRVMARSGTKTYLLQRRTRQGRNLKLKLGRAGEVSADWARRRALELIREMSAGADPAANLRAQRDAERERRRAPTVERMIGEWLESGSEEWRPNTVVNYQRWVALHVLPVLGRRKATELESGDVRAWYQAISDTGKAATANRCLAVLSSAFSWAMASDDWPGVTANPCARAIHKARRAKERKRERYLDAHALRRLVTVLHDRSDVYGVFFLALLMTGARRGELVAARWSDFELGEHPTWRKPGGTTKQKRDHLVPLASKVAQMLRGLRTGEPFGGPFARLGESGIRREWEVVRRKASLVDFRVHDLRHQFASLLISNGYSLELIGQLLGHANTGTTQRYAHLLLEPQRLAAGKVAEIVDLAGRRSG